MTPAFPPAVPGRVKAAYSSGKPAFGVGQGNVQEIVDLGISDAELERQATLCVAHRARTTVFPAQVPRPYISMPSSWSSGRDTCRSMALSSLIRMKILRPFVLWCSLTVAPSSTEQLWASSPIRWAKWCGLNIPETAKIMLVKNQAWGEAEVLCREILFPIVRYTVYEKFEDAVDRAVANLEVEGAGHTSTLWTTNDDHVEYAAKRIPVGRFHINQPTMGGRIPIITSITTAAAPGAATLSPKT